MAICKGLLLSIALLLAGCAGMRESHPPQPEQNKHETIVLYREGDRENRQTIELLNYAQRFATMTHEQQLAEFGAISREFATDPDPPARMRLALVLATTGTSVHDAARAASLLEPMIAAGDTPGPLRSLARVLHALLTEDANEHKRAERMRDLAEMRKKLERTLREQLEASKEAERTMREQLDALKDVERTMLQRGQASQSRRK